MYGETTVRCPMCSGRDTYGFERTVTGRVYYCHECGHRWKLTVEDEALDMLGLSFLGSERGSRNDYQTPRGQGRDRRNPRDRRAHLRAHH
jgi:DNA-directed RNA polymerase subunit RPC12/RpoP